MRIIRENRCIARSRKHLGERIGLLFTLISVLIISMAPSSVYASVSRKDTPGVSDTTPKDTFDILMVGDILLHDGIEQCARREDGSYDFDALFTHTADDISSADMAIVNQEVIIGGSELSVSGYPCFNAPFEAADALCDAGFDVICHATNHALDKGGKGIKSCLKNWRESHEDVEVVGISDDGENNSMCIFEQDGMKIAVLNYTYGTNGIQIPKSMPNAVSLLDKAQIIKDLEYAEEECDFTIVCPHWGNEYSLSPSAGQEKMAQFLADNGADLIIGTHPHVLEPVVWVEGSDTGQQALCYYSLGNYVNWTSGRGGKITPRMVGGMAKVSLIREKDGTVRISEYELVPLVTHLEERRDGATVYKLSDYTEELLEKSAVVKMNPSFSFEAIEDILDKVGGNNG